MRMGRLITEVNMPVEAIESEIGDAYLRLATSAGTVAYRVFLTGKRVVYFGRKGEIHVEEFPGAKSQQ